MEHRLKNQERGYSTKHSAEWQIFHRLRSFPGGYNPRELAPRPMHPDSVSLLRKLTVFTLFALGLFLAYELLHLLAIIAFAAFLTTLFSPALATFNRWKIPDFLGVLFIYFGVFVLAATVFATTLPIFATQIVALFSTLSGLAGKLATDYAAGGVGALGLPGFLVPLVSLFDPSSVLASLRDNAGGIAKSTAAFLSSVGIKGAGAFVAFGTGVADVVLVLVFTFFFVLERRKIRDFFYLAVGEKAAAYFRSKETPIVTTLAAWMRGQLLLGLSIFSLTLVGLYALEWIFGIRLESRFALALIAGITEFIPYLGPVLALLPALALALGMSPEAVFAVLGLYFVIQQLENHALVPWLMSKSLDLSPFYVLVMTTVGASLGGVVGILVALPAAGILRIFADDLFPKKPAAKPSKV